MIHRHAVRQRPAPKCCEQSVQRVSRANLMPRSDCEQTSKGRSGDFARFARFARNHFPAAASTRRDFARLLAGDLAETVATISRDGPAVSGD